MWGVSDAGGQGIEFIRAERSSRVESKGHEFQKKGMGESKFPTITELSELRHPRFF
jgi:hypothetical protein